MYSTWVIKVMQLLRYSVVFKALDYVDHMRCSSINNHNNIIIFEQITNIGFVHLLGKELPEQKVDNTGCPYDSSRLREMFLPCRRFKSVTFAIHTLQNLSCPFLMQSNRVHQSKRKSK